MAKEELGLVKFEANGETISLSFPTVRNYLVRGDADVTDQEVGMFIRLCQYQKLNPFLNEAYLVKFKGSPAQIVTGKEAFMKRAESHPQYDGFRAGIIIRRKEQLLEVEGCFTAPGDELLGGWCEVYRKDRKYPITEKVSLEEYDKKRSTWSMLAKTMIRKVAIVHALREAFPSNLGALYTEEDYENGKVPDEKGPTVNPIGFDALQRASVVDVECEPVEETPETEAGEPEQEQMAGPGF